jgi:predicted RNA binding protein YcfA (HicA-like mRNA interferase family)
MRCSAMGSSSVANLASHQIYYHPDGRRVTVTFHHPSDAFPIKTLKRILEEEAGWTEKDLRRLKLLK